MAWSLDHLVLLRINNIKCHMFVLYLNIEIWKHLNRHVFVWLYLEWDLIGKAFF
jgi:hypothetical protein